MKLVYLCALMVIFCPPAVGAQKIAPSQIHVWAPVEVQEPYRKARELFFQGRFAEAAGYFREASRAKELKDRPSSLLLNYEGLCYQYMDNFPQARRLFEKALLASVEGSDSVDSLRNIGWLAYLEGNLQEALARLQEADALHQRMPKEESVSPQPIRRSVRINLGIVQEALGNFPAAYQAFLYCLNYIEKDAHPMNETRLFQHLGSLEVLWGDRSLALAHYQRSLEAPRKRLIPRRSRASVNSVPESTMGSQKRRNGSAG